MDHLESQDLPPNVRLIRPIQKTKASQAMAGTSKEKYQRKAYRAELAKLRKAIDLCM